MKKFLLIPLFLILLLNNIIAQNATSGITVITHGFTPSFSDIDEWKAHAIELREYAKLRTGKGATVFINNPKTGFWEILDAYSLKNLGGAYTGTYYTQSKINISNIDKQGELIFLYNWANVSDNGLFSSKISYLEAAADNLFAMLIDPQIAGKSFKTQSLHNIIFPNSSSSAGRLFAERPSHLIGHTRSFHRNYFF